MIARRRRAGLTITELVISSLLVSILALVCAGTWRRVGTQVVDAINQFRLTQERNLAIESLARDFGGTQPDDPYSWSGGKAHYQCKQVEIVPIGPLDGLKLHFDGGPDPADPSLSLPDRIVTYSFRPQPVKNRLDEPTGTLVRSDESTGLSFTVAENALPFSIIKNQEDNRLTILLNFLYHRNAVTSTFTVLSRAPVIDSRTEVSP